MTRDNISSSIDGLAVLMTGGDALLLQAGNYCLRVKALRVDC